MMSRNRAMQPDFNLLFYLAILVGAKHLCGGGLVRSRLPIRTAVESSNPTGSPCAMRKAIKYGYISQIQTYRQTVNPVAAFRNRVFVREIGSVVVCR